MLDKKKNNRRLLALVLGLSILASLLAACNSEGKMTDPSAGTTAATGGESKTAATVKPVVKLDPAVQDQPAVELKTKDSQGKEVKRTLTVKELNMYAGLVGANILPQGVFADESQAALDGPGKDKEKTLREELAETALEIAGRDFFVMSSAQQSDVTEKQAAIDQKVDELIANLKQQASQTGKAIDEFYKLTFGPTADEESVRAFFQLLFQSTGVQSDKYESFHYSDKELTDKYEADPKQFDVAKYHFYVFNEPKPQPSQTSASGETTPSEPAEQESALDRAKAMEAQVKDEASYLAAAGEQMKKDFADFPKDKVDPAQPEKLTLNENVRFNQMPPEMGEWMFSPDRKYGDHTIVPFNGGQGVLFFLDRSRPETKVYSSRNLLLSTKPDQTKATGEQGAADQDDLKAKAKAKIEELKTEFLAGDKTEEAFAELVKQHSEDPGSKDRGGEYQNVRKGQFVPAYEEFCMDPARKPGDVGIVESDYGYHLIYFQGLGRAEWQEEVAKSLANEAMNQWLAESTEKVSSEKQEAWADVIKP